MNKIYVVTGQTGEYSDNCHWLVKAFTTEKKAQHFVVLATREAKKIEATRVERYSVPKGKNKYDPEMLMDYTGTFYNYDEVILDK